MTNDEIKKLTEKAKRYAIYRGHADDSDDFAQEVIVWKLRGRESKLEFLLTDYLRQVYGRTGSRGNLRRPGKSGNNTISIEDAGDSLGNLCSMDNQSDSGRGSRVEPLDIRAARIRSNLQCFVAVEALVHERGQDDIADELGVTESRVCQILKPIKRSLEENLLFTGYLGDYIEDEERHTFRIAWIDL